MLEARVVGFQYIVYALLTAVTCGLLAASCAMPESLNQGLEECNDGDNGEIEMM
jgi:hypothetical protein